VSHKDAPPETDVQRACREWWTARLGQGAVGWGRDKAGRFLAEFARNAEAAWRAAQEQALALSGANPQADNRGP
jgi:hypothetical protein